MFVWLSQVRNGDHRSAVAALSELECVGAVSGAEMLQIVGSAPQEGVLLEGGVAPGPISGVLKIALTPSSAATIEFSANASEASVHVHHAGSAGRSPRPAAQNDFATAESIERIAEALRHLMDAWRTRCAIMLAVEDGSVVTLTRAVHASFGRGAAARAPFVAAAEARLERLSRLVRVSGEAVANVDQVRALLCSYSINMLMLADQVMAEACMREASQLRCLADRTVAALRAVVAMSVDEVVAGLLQRHADSAAVIRGLVCARSHFVRTSHDMHALFRFRGLRSPAEYGEANNTRDAGGAVVVGWEMLQHSREPIKTSLTRMGGRQGNSFRAHCCRASVDFDRSHGAVETSVRAFTMILAFMGDCVASIPR